MSEKVWALIFGLPLITLVFIWARCLFSARSESKRVAAWPALLFTMASAFAGVWGLLHAAELSKRSAFDYGYECKAWLISLIGLIAAIVWVVRVKQWLSWATLVIAGWLNLIWMMLASQV